MVGTALVSIVLGMIPVFGVLYWAGMMHGTWQIVLVVHLLIVAAGIATLLRQLSVFSAVSATELSGRGIFSPLERVPFTEISDVVIVPTYVGESPEPVKQLLVRNAAGQRVFRMRGNFWHPDDLAAIAAALPVKPTVVKEPMILSDFFRLYPGSAYWFENKATARISILVGTLFGAAALTYWIVRIFHG